MPSPSKACAPGSVWRSFLPANAPHRNALGPSFDRAFASRCFYCKTLPRRPDTFDLRRRCHSKRTALQARENLCRGTRSSYRQTGPMAGAKPRATHDSQFYEFSGTSLLQRVPAAEYYGPAGHVFKQEMIDDGELSGNVHGVLATGSLSIQSGLRAQNPREGHVISRPSPGRE